MTNTRRSIGCTETYGGGFPDVIALPMFIIILIILLFL